MTADGGRHEAKRLVLAPGVTDTLPEVEGLQERWGRSVFHCPYCHGYELGGGLIGVIAVGEVSLHHGLMLPDWGSTVFFVNGSFDPTAEQLAQLAARGATVERTPLDDFATWRALEARFAELLPGKRAAEAPAPVAERTPEQVP